MKKFYRRKNSASQLVFLHFLLLVLFCSACSKKSQEPAEVIKTETDIYAYEVTCTSCEIQFLDKNKITKNITNNVGKWSYSLEKVNDADLKIKIIATSRVYQKIEAYILKNNDVIYGEAGYNTFELSYHVRSGQKSMTYGNYIAETGDSGGSGGSAGSGSGSGSSGGSTKPSSSVCGARNKTGGYCQRLVSGGGRCWQHK